MQILKAKGKLSNLKYVDIDFCKHCIFGKQKKARFLKVGATKKEQKSELVHSDVWRPTQVASHGGSQYYVTFIDDAIRKVWVYCIKRKYDVFETFKIWKALVENETNLKLKCLISENGGEYYNKVFDDYCSVNGIRKERTILRTPHENGVAERMNKTIMECARSMMINCIGWWNTRRSLDWKRVFGLEAFVHVDKENRKKLDAKSKRCTLIGYGYDDFGFRFWDLEDAKIVRSRNIDWNENRMYRDQFLLPKNEPGEGDEPKSFEETMQQDTHMEWEHGMDVEMDSLEKNQTWDLNIAKRVGLQDQGGRGWKKRYKTRLVVKGFAQKVGIDFGEIFSPIVKMTSIRTVLSLVTTKYLHLKQLNVKTTFLHGSSLQDIGELKEKLAHTFAMKYLGVAKKIIDMQIHRDRKNMKLYLSQEDYINKVLERFKMKDIKPVSTPMAGHFKLSKDQFPTSHEGVEYMVWVPYASSVGILMYVMVYTRLDIAQVVGVMSRFMVNPEVEYVAAKEASKEMIWMSRFMEELGKEQEDCRLYGDSQSAGLKVLGAFCSSVRMKGEVQLQASNEQEVGDAESAPLLQPPAIGLVEKDGEINDEESDTSSAACCRICLELEGSDPGDELISPCMCKGTQQFVHRYCLDHWRSVNEGFAFSHCTTCKAQFHLRTEIPEDYSWRKLKFRIFVARDVLLVFLAVQTTIAVMGSIAYLMDTNGEFRNSFSDGWDRLLSKHPIPFYYCFDEEKWGRFEGGCWSSYNKKIPQQHHGHLHPVVAEITVTRKVAPVPSSSSSFGASRNPKTQDPDTPRLTRCHFEDFLEGERLCV
ncbi:hypothetical protein KI387_032839 [Taxus chinensis]|uniref:RING-CH-type domain-containing protein n=1 Tax=Taxus chinensis TaxID=29808 RepID=A0AA38BSQ7_TAXCH|nr:hypothetical protein KI387_032839 [Taxus chinensis]